MPPPPRLRRSASLSLAVLAVLSLSPTAEAQFAMLVGDALALVNTSKPGDGFSVQDKMLPCNNGLVLVDLDSDLAVNCVPPACPPPATLQQCSNSAAARRIQQWNKRGAGPGLALTQLSLAAPPPYFFSDGTCMDQGGVFNGSFAYGWHCRDPADPAHSNQWWTISPDGRLYSNATAAKYKKGLCLTAGGPGVAPRLEVELTMQPCDVAADAQTFAFSDVDGTLRHVSTNLCVDAGVIGRTVTWDGKAWSARRIIPHACPDAGNPALLPRDRVGTYTVGRTKIDGDPAKGDRLIVIGGDDSSNNVFVSDNCGIDWTCFDGDQPWTTFGLSYAPVLTLDALPGAPLIMAGGLANTLGGAEPSSALYYALDGGAGTWQRGYDLPYAGVFPGAIAQDRSTVYVFGNATTGFDVWSVDESTYNTSGFALVPGSAFAQGADVGRREYVRGAVSGGCWFATDFSPGDLWAAQRTSGTPIASSNTVFVARAATGPWASYTAPWTPRASAAVVLSRDGTQVFVAGGVGFAGGAPTGEVFADVWSIDARVCLLAASNGAVCGGHGAANLSDVSCACDAAWSGDDRCGSCTLGTFGPSCGSTCPTGSGGGGFCNAGRGFGVCDPVAGCVCSGNHVDGPARACDGCASLAWGTACDACPACVAAHTVGGACDGSGTAGGTGVCVCRAGFVGPLCADAAPSASPSPAPASAASSASAVDAGGPAAIAAGVLVPLLVLAAGAFAFVRRSARAAAAANPPLLRAAAAGSPVRDLAAAAAAAAAGALPANVSERASLLNAARGSTR